MTSERPATPLDVMATLEEGLQRGGVLHGFRAEGGLRVVRIERGRKGALMGYGEHPDVMQALRHVAEHYAAGGRPNYRDIYGDKYRRYTHGPETASSPLDGWVCHGHSFDAYAPKNSAGWTTGLYVAELCSLQHTERPEDVKERALRGEAVTWQARGYTFRTESNQHGGVMTSLLDRPQGMPERLAWIYDGVQTGEGRTLQEAFDQAFQAPAVEAAVQSLLAEPELCRLNANGTWRNVRRGV